MAGYLGSKAAFLSTTTANVTGDSTIGGNIIVGGTVDGRDIAADGALIDGLNALTTTQNLYSGDDSTVNFTLPFAPVDVNGISVYVDGVHQDNNSISTTGTALIFAEAPPTGTDNIVVRMVATGVTNFTTATNVVAKKEYATVALLLADTTDGTFFNTGDYVTVVEGGFSYKVATVGDVTNAGGIQFDVLAGDDGSLSVNAFGALGDNSNDDTVAIQTAITSLATNSYEQGKSLVFAAGIYRVTSTITVPLDTSSLTLVASTRATLSTEVADDAWTIDVDYSTGGTANFPSFNMTNITISDIAAPLQVKNGIRTARVLASKFTQCEFNYLKVAVEMNDNSNLNTFDTCMWRANTNAWKSTDGVANNNVFLNCQWRYHAGTAVDTTGTGGTVFIGGDAEPGNANPVFILNGTTMQATRIERNIQGEMIRLIDNNEVSAYVHSDGGTQADPGFNVTGSYNTVNALTFSGAKVAIFGSSSTNNNLIVDSVSAPLLNGLIVSDLGVNNLIKTAGSVQSTTSITEFRASDNLAPADLTTWTSTGMTVTPVVTGQTFSLTNTAAAAGNIQYTIPGTFTDLYIAVATRAQQVQGRVLVYVDKGAGFVNINSVSPDTTLRRGVVVATGTMTNPIVKIEIITALSGVGSDVEYLRVAEGRVPS